MNKEEAIETARVFIETHKDLFNRSLTTRERDYKAFNSIGLEGIVFTDAQICQMYLTYLLMVEDRDKRNGLTS